MSPIVSLLPGLTELVDPAAQVEQIATGFGFTEGPAWDRRSGRLVFVDIRADALYEWREGASHRVLRSPSGVSNGNTFDAEGRLVTCEMGGRRLIRMAADGSVEALVDDYEGKRLSGPNDVVRGPDGALYFTDMRGGLQRSTDGTYPDRELPFWGVFRYDPAGGSLSIIADDFDLPNGLVISADGRQLLVNDTIRSHVRRFELAPDGTSKDLGVFCEVTRGDVVGRPDGMKLDAQGNLYVTANTDDGVWVYNPAGELLGFIDVGEGPANCAFGGADWRTLYVTARTSVYRLPLKVAGQPVGV
jgi:gluconolactonase